MSDRHMTSLRAASTVLLVGLGLIGASLAPDHARAQTAVSHFSPTGVEIDGNYLDDAGPVGDDWYPSYAPFRDPVSQDDTTLCGTSPAPKNDVTNSFVANNFDYLYMGMERRANTGNTSFFFSFDITGDGPSLGDFVFVFCFGSGDLVTETYVMEWNAALGAFAVDSTPPSVDFAVNAVRILAPFGALDRHGRPSSTIDPGKFGEARVRLADIEGFDVCAANAVTLEIETRSSCSLRSQCKDTTGPLLFSFTPLTAEIELSQPAGCAPEIVATAHAVSPRPDLITYRWFLNGEEITDRDPSWTTSDSIVIALADECGPVEVAVEVNDGTCIVPDSGVVDVNRIPVAGIAVADVDPCTGLLVYSGATSTDCGGQPLTFAWDFESDGVIDSVDSNGVHAYVSCGERLITLRVADGECESLPVTLAVYVNEPPEAGLAIRPSDTHCLEIAFDVTSADCDLGQSSALYTESLASSTDFGDGSPSTTDLSGTHRYATCGAYVVVTTTRDASGCESSVTRVVTVDVVAEVE